MDSSWSLRQKAEKGIFARLLDDQIPHGALVLEAGCGTGQLSNFLGMRWGRDVFGTDICLNSLKLAQGFRAKNGIQNAAFLQMNLFRPVFRPASFDLVICNGVLHHTSDPSTGFRSIARLVKPGGFVVVGLYNAYGRIPTDVRRGLFQLAGERLWSLDARLRDRSLSDTRRRTWFMDQYRHPHESKHTFGEVLRWFEEAGFEFLKSIPKPRLLDSFSAKERLFEAGPRGTPLDHLLVQLGMLVGGGKEGGFFIMIGRKKP
jgi:SAM-dependent methyltransferase